MPRKKKAKPQETEAKVESVGPDTEAEADAIEETWKSLKAAVRAEERRLNDWDFVITNPDIQNVLDQFLGEEQELRESLATCKPKDLIRLQENIKARNELVFRLRQRGDGAELMRLRDELGRFESDNALFVEALKERDKPKGSERRPAKETAAV